MNHPLETFTLNGYTVEIHPDHDAENPRLVQQYPVYPAPPPYFRW